MSRTPFLACSVLALACGNPTNAEPEPAQRELARKAVSADASVARQAIAQLREAGPAGLEALLDVHSEAIGAHSRSASAATRTDRESWDRLSAALNAVGGQYDCHAARLYWYTDLDKARARAKATGKPILSLRLLGQLTEECSCANSRFFRTVLYANGEVSRTLREQFVLHWQSVR